MENKYFFQNLILFLVGLGICLLPVAVPALEAAIGVFVVIGGIVAISGLFNMLCGPK